MLCSLGPRQRTFKRPLPAKSVNACLYRPAETVFKALVSLRKFLSVFRLDTFGPLTVNQMSFPPIKRNKKFEKVKNSGKDLKTAAF